MTVSEIMKEFVAYYGPWSNSAVQERVVAEIMRYSDREIEGIRDEVMRKRPAQWGAPDVATIAEAITGISAKRTPVLRSGERSGTIICPVCQNVIRGTSGVCHTCAYVLGDDIDEHSGWWERYQEGKEPRYDIGLLLDGIVQKTRVTWPSE
jgi:NaMN:DMB phosphoribosyltransferase